MLHNAGLSHLEAWARQPHNFDGSETVLLFEAFKASILPVK